MKPAALVTVIFLVLVALIHLLRLLYIIGSLYVAFSALVAGGPPDAPTWPVAGEPVSKTKALNAT